MGVARNQAGASQIFFFFIDVITPHCASEHRQPPTHTILSSSLPPLWLVLLPDPSVGWGLGTRWLEIGNAYLNSKSINWKCLNQKMLPYYNTTILCYTGTHHNFLSHFDNIIIIIVVTRKRAHGRCTLPWGLTGRWADIAVINIMYYYLCNLLCSSVIWTFAYSVCEPIWTSLTTSSGLLEN